jgi:ATP-dependent RNA helicase SUPV3L1/SUV3
MPDASRITAVLGPTNTGKTHRAVERMLDYDSGMIGVPLRLLARELYDRLTNRLGEAAVALVTGEEKRVPRRPKYWVCTVEAMPLEREVDFVAVDEVQLAADAQRGHVFTDRLLNARGRIETWFLGSETVAPLLEALVPTAKRERHPRLSDLRHVGSAPLGKLPARSAVVAFSTPQVYELAERIRALRGGAAVVLGALSPRTRNAQVAMFQAGEVDYLVATDAIGMGLNLDVRHVAFAAARKFDGREVRELDAAELAQIAGRAGRHVQDGTFGTVAPLSLAPHDVAAVEGHVFRPLRRLRYRSSDLDFVSVEALLASLRARPPAPFLERVDDADDTQALTRLANDADVAAAARGEERVALLWDVCRIPDYRKLLFEAHAALLAQIFLRLAHGGVLSDDWLAPKIAELDDPRGDEDTLLARIAAIRTWTYVSHQHARTRPSGGASSATPPSRAWVEDPEHWQMRTRAIEDRLSDALHERLVSRFVERGGKRRRSLSRPSGATRKDDEAPSVPSAVDPSHPFAALRAMRAALSPPDRPSAPDGDDLAERLERAPHDAIAVDASGVIAFEGRAIARLVRGSALLLPDVRIARDREGDPLGKGAERRVLRRLTAWARDEVADLLTPLSNLESFAQGAARGLLHCLRQGLGAASPEAATVPLAALAPHERVAFDARGVSFSPLGVYVPALLDDRALARRRLLVGIHVGHALPKPHAVVSFRPARTLDRDAWLAMGYVAAGPRVVRIDVAARVAEVVARGPVKAREVATWIGSGEAEAAVVVTAIGRLVSSFEANARGSPDCDRIV